MLFEVGLETNLKEFIELGKTSLLVAILGVVAPFFLGFGFVYLIDSSAYVFDMIS